MSIFSTLQSTAFTVELQDWAESTTSGQTKGGKLLVIAIFVCNLISVILYIIDTNRELMEECISWEQLITLQVKVSYIDCVLKILLCRLTLVLASSSSCISS